MNNLDLEIREFLSQKVIAIAGVSRNKNETANVIYRKFKDGAYTVYPVNPAADEVEGVKCYHSVSDIPDQTGAVVAVIPPDKIPALVNDCAASGVRHLWMHGGFNNASVNTDVLRDCKRHGIHVIPGACPMMYLEPVDPFHKCFHWWKKVRHTLPEPV